MAQYVTSRTIACLTVLVACLNLAAAQPEDEKPEWTPLFNGKDLTGWKAEGKASWKVEDGCIVGRQGPKGEAGDLFSEKEYENFELAVTFKMRWPGNSGVWFRYQDPKVNYQADILDYKDPVCFTGSLYCPGHPFLALNEDKNLGNNDEWNTFLIRAQADRIVLILNDMVTADVSDRTSAKGKVGFQVHAGDDFKEMQITIEEAKIRELHGQKE